MKFIKYILILIIIIFLLLFLYLKYIDYSYIKVNNINIDKINDENIDNKKVTNKDYNINNFKDYYNNQDIYGIISINGSKFKMLFAKGRDNSYYLNHLLDNTYNKLGSIYLDYRSNIDTDKKINIYGHNNNDVGMSFNYLMNYLDYNFYNKYKKIEIITDNNKYIYNVFSIQIVNKNYNHMNLSFNDNKFVDYINNIKNNSIYYDNIDINNIKSILTLQTCTNQRDYEYLLVNAYRII